MNIAMSKELSMFIWENSQSATSVVGRDRLSVQLHPRPRHRLRPSTLRQSLPTTDVADWLLSYVNVGSLLLMAVFMAEHCAVRRGG